MYSNYNSIQDFCAEIKGNDETFEKTTKSINQF